MADDSKQIYENSVKAQDFIDTLQVPPESKGQIYDAYSRQWDDPQKFYDVLDRTLPDNKQYGSAKKRLAELRFPQAAQAAEQLGQQARPAGTVKPKSDKPAWYDRAILPFDQLVKMPARPQRAPDPNAKLPPMLEQAATSYPGIAGTLGSIAFRASPGKVGDRRSLEFYPPGEEESFDSSKPAVEVFGGRATAKDIAGDLASHYLNRGIDPTVTKAYKDFEASLTPAQKRRLQDQYQWAVKHEKEKRPYQEWYETSGLPAYFRGYAFDQWPDPDVYYTQDQLRHFDELNRYLKTPGPSRVAQFAQGAAHGGLEAAAGLTTPKNIGLMAAMGAAQFIPVVGEVVDIGAGMYFTVSALQNMARSWPELKKAYQEGDYGRLGELVGEDTASAVAAFFGAKHTAGRMAEGGYYMPESADVTGEPRFRYQQLPPGTPPPPGVYGAQTEPRYGPDVTGVRQAGEATPGQRPDYSPRQPRRIEGREQGRLPPPGPPPPPMPGPRLGAGPPPPREIEAPKPPGYDISEIRHPHGTEKPTRFQEEPEPDRGWIAPDKPLSENLEQAKTIPIEQLENVVARMNQNLTDRASAMAKEAKGDPGQLAQVKRFLDQGRSAIGLFQGILDERNAQGGRSLRRRGPSRPKAAEASEEPPTEPARTPTEPRRRGGGAPAPPAAPPPGAPPPPPPGAAAAPVAPPLPPPGAPPAAATAVPAEPPASAPETPRPRTSRAGSRASQERPTVTPPPPGAPETAGRSGAAQRRETPPPNAPEPKPATRTVSPSRNITALKDRMVEEIIRTRGGITRGQLRERFAKDFPFSDEEFNRAFVQAAADPRMRVAQPRPAQTATGPRPSAPPTPTTQATTPTAPTPQEAAAESAAEPPNAPARVAGEAPGTPTTYAAGLESGIGEAFQEAGRKKWKRFTINIKRAGRAAIKIGVNTEFDTPETIAAQIRRAGGTLDSEAKIASEENPGLPLTIKLGERPPGG